MEEASWQGKSSDSESVRALAVSPGTQVGVSRGGIETIKKGFFLPYPASVSWGKQIPCLLFLQSWGLGPVCHPDSVRHENAGKRHSTGELEDLTPANMSRLLPSVLFPPQLHLPETGLKTASPKASLSKFKKTAVISSIFSNHNTMKLEINYTKKLQRTQTHGG